MSVMERKRKVGSAEERGVKRRRLERDSLSPSSEGEISIHASYDDEFLESPSEHTRADPDLRNLSPLPEPDVLFGDEVPVEELASGMDPFPLAKSSKPVRFERRRYRVGAEEEERKGSRENHKSASPSLRTSHRSKLDLVKKSSSARSSPRYGEDEREWREEAERGRREEKRDRREEEVVRGRREGERGRREEEWRRYEESMERGRREREYSARRHEHKDKHPSREVRHVTDWRGKEGVGLSERGRRGNAGVSSGREALRAESAAKRAWRRRDEEQRLHSRSPRRLGPSKRSVEHSPESRPPVRPERREAGEEGRRAGRHRDRPSEQPLAVPEESESESESDESVRARRVEEIEELIKDLEDSDSGSESDGGGRGRRAEASSSSSGSSVGGRGSSSSRLSEVELAERARSHSSSSGSSPDGSPVEGVGQLYDVTGRPVVRSKFDDSMIGAEPLRHGYSGYDAASMGSEEEDERDEEEEVEEEEEVGAEGEGAIGAVEGEGGDVEGEALSPPGPRLPPYLPALMGCRSVENYEYLNKIEEGTYGVVFRARDRKSGETVALKKLKMEKEKEGFPITSLREINMLLKAEHPNVVHVKEIVVGSNMDKIYIVMEYVEHDLKALMETMKQPFLEGEVKTLLIQLLRAVHHLHDNWILHRDLKASNLLLSHKGILKVGDFGLAREYGSPLRNYTPVVVTLWYRSPELLLGAKEYSTAVDMWSVGCIFAEFLLQKPLFRGKSEIDQLNQIFKELGTPSEELWPGYSKLSVPQKVTFTKQPYNNLRKKFPYLTKNGFDLLNRFLTYDPARRITAEQALDHPYLKEAPLPVDPSMFPTWPAKSERTSKEKVRERSPTAPEGGAFFKQDDEDSQGFRMTLAKQGQSAGGPGFQLKF